MAAKNSRLGPRGSRLVPDCIAVLVLASCSMASGGRQTNALLSNWPRGASPREVGKKVAARFVDSPHVSNKEIVYQEVCAWYGAMTFAHATRDSALSARLRDRYDHLSGPQEAGLVPQSGHVDRSVFGSVPLELAIETKSRAYLTEGLAFADRQWLNPLPDGLSPETRFWIDDMYMITLLQVEAYRATLEAKYIDRAAAEMATYLDKLQRQNGLFYHAPDAPFFWGRGNGWVAAGMAELLTSLPAKHPLRSKILRSYRKMMDALVAVQGSDGMWRQLLDHTEAWPESSATGMFTFALITGVKNGWLQGPRYTEAARKGWLALVAHIDANGDISDVCEGTGKKNDLAYYLARKRKTGDMHGQAPVLWCASALLARGM